VQRLARLADALLARAQRAKVLGRLGRHVGKQLKLDAAGLGVGNGDVKEHLCVAIGLAIGAWKFSGM
jgi:hypothetical protein